MLLLSTLAWGAPIATYGMDEDGGTALWDTVGAAHGCIVGPHGRVSGVVDGGVDLRGGAIQLPLSVSEPATVALYQRGDEDGVVLSLGDLSLEVVDGAWQIGGITVTDPPPSPGIWRHVAVSVDGGFANLWVGQELVGTTLVTGSLGPVLVGSAADGGGAWRGSVDEVAVLDSAASADELRVLTTGFHGPTEGADCGDYDDDGLDDLIELALGTDPQRYDSDSDTLDDGSEVGDPADPIDTDDDGIIDALDDDDDNDGISSAKERTSDADGDGAPDLDADSDGIENAKDLDSDGDGIPDEVEGVEDSDGDGILDFLDAVDDTAPAATDTGVAAVGGEDDGGCGCVAAPSGWSWKGWLRRR